MRFAALLTLLASSLFGQDGQTVSLSQGSAPYGYQLVTGWKTLSISACTKASPMVCTVAASGIAIGKTFTGVISGATGTGWTAINAYWTATSVTATTISIAVDSSGFGTLAGTIIFTTEATAYTCISKSNDPNRLNNAPIAISAISKANPGIVTSAGHGFPISTSSTNTALMERPEVRISGATGTGWVTNINATFTAVVIDVDTFSLYSQAGTALDTSGYGTLAGTVVFKTTAPRETIYEWAVKKFAYDPALNFKQSTWLTGKGSPPAIGSSQYSSRCSDISSAVLNQQ